MITFHLVLMILAIVCFFLAFILNLQPQPPQRYNLIAGGLCLWALASIVTV
jgi:hypothetical protein